MVAEESEIRARYEAAGQEHVFQFFPSLSEEQKKALLSQLHSIPVEKMSTLLEAALADQGNASDQSSITPFSGKVTRDTDTVSSSAIENARELGLTAIREKQVAAVVLAGGQGTRLGFDGPKGMYDIGLPSHSTLFQMVSDRIKKLCQLAGGDASLPFYIMTSPLNHTQTVQFFHDNNNFGLPDGDLHFFEQGMLPCLQEDGKIIMESAHQVAMAPDGNGGIYPALDESGILDNMKERGIKYLQVFSIDNALVKPADPIFVGYCIAEGADCGNKVLWKASAHEKVGVLAEKRGKPCIVEYSEISKDMAEMTDDDGKLKFGAANICNHFYTIDFLRGVILPNMGNLYHIARKKIPFYDPATAKTVTPTKNNGIKLESFIFDVFPLSVTMAVLDVKRSEEFAPVKNAPGSPSDSPDTAREMISARSKKWVESAGGNLSGDKDAVCEVTAATSYDGEGLEAIAKDKAIECPFSL